MKLLRKQMNVEQKVKQTLSKLKLNKREKILVALSGGKDSTATAYLLKKFGYKIEGIHINLGMGQYSERCLNAVKELCNELEIKLHLYDIKKEMGASMCYIRTTIQEQKKGLKNCAICGVIKKWILNKRARELKGEKIATGHNLDDEAQTFLINIFKGNLELSANTGVISKNTNDKKLIPRLKPLFYIPENEV
jgi:tRNA-5-methyluridine54 2-sulfurtransferase